MAWHQAISWTNVDQDSPVYSYLLVKIAKGTATATFLPGLA